MHRAPRILYVDDDRQMLDAVEMALGLTGIDIVTVSGASEASREIVDFDPDLILLDLDMPGVDGEQLITVLSDFFGEQGARTVIFSAMLPSRIEQAVERTGALGAVPKDCDLDALGATLLSFIETPERAESTAVRDAVHEEEAATKGRRPLDDPFWDALETKKSLESADTLPLRDTAERSDVRAPVEDVTDFIPETIRRHDSGPRERAARRRAESEQE